MQHEGVTTRPHPTRLTRLLGSVLLSILILLAGAVARAEVVVHSPEEVLADWTVEQDGRLYFRAPGGRLWELITDINDPAIANRGAGSFFPADRAWVDEALATCGLVETLEGNVFILPYPRRALLPSNAEGHSIFLTPGVAPYARDQVHALVTHELGHVFHNTYLPDANRDGWAAYRVLRGIEDTSIYNDQAAHRNRPHEIFAEDFRALFGGVRANYSGGIENPNLTAPDNVPGLADFVRALPEAAPFLVGREPLPLFPNPTPAGVTLVPGAAPGVGAYHLTVHDVQGRLVATRVLGEEGSLQWDGRGIDGALAAPGLYFLRLARGERTWAAKLLVQR